MMGRPKVGAEVKGDSNSSGSDLDLDGGTDGAEADVRPDDLAVDVVSLFLR